MRGRGLAVEHVPGMLAADDSAAKIWEGCPWMERADVQACLVYQRARQATARPVCVASSAMNPLDSLRGCDRDRWAYGRFMPVALPLHKMSREEKLRAMEALWTDLSQDEKRFESPPWHKDALRAAEDALEAGKTQFSDWAEAKKRIRRKATRLG